MLFDSRFGSRLVALRWLPVATTLLSVMAYAQPPLAPSTVAKPAPNPFGAPVPPPDPPQISAAELQALTGGPTLVSLEGENLALGDVVRALADAGPVPVQPLWGGNVEAKISVHWNALPFWEAAAEVEALTAQKWDGYGEGLGLRPAAQGGLDGKTMGRNPFITLLAQSLTHTSTRTLSFAPTTPARIEPDRVQLQMVAYFDPRLRVQQSVTRALRFQKQGEATVIPGTDTRAGYEYGGRSRLITPITAALPAEIAAGTHLARLSGVLHTVIASNIQTLALTDVVAAGKTTKAIGPHQYSIEGATVEGEQLNLRLAAAFGAEAARDRNLIATSLFSSLRLRDSAGHDLTSSGGSSTYGGATASSNYRYNLKDAKGDLMPGPYSLEWRIATEFKSLDVPFELRDIVVP